MISDSMRYIVRLMGLLALIGAAAASPRLWAACEQASKPLPFTDPFLGAGFDADGALFVDQDGSRFLFAATSPPLDQAPEEPCVLTVQKRDGAVFIVVVVHRWSNGVPSGSQCGGGVNSDVLWLRIVDAWIVSERKERFVDCHLNRDGGFAWDGTKLRVTTNDWLRETTATDKPSWRDIVWTFDASEPQKGLIERVGRPRHW